MNAIEFAVCLSLVVFSATLSASEIALFTLSRFQLRFLKEHFRPVHRKVKLLLNDPGGLLVTVLVANEILNIVLSTIIARLVSRQLPEIPHWLTSLPPVVYETMVSTAVVTPIILLLCEISPKIVGAKANQLIATATADLLALLYRAFKPIRYVLGQILNAVSSQHQHNGSDSSASIGESEFLLLVEEGLKEGAVKTHELDLIRNVFELDNTLVSEIQTPLAQVLCLNANTSAKEALDFLKHTNYSRIPVIGKNRRDIHGVLHKKDLLRTKLDPELLKTPISTLINPPFFVPANLKLNALFRKFKKLKTHMAIVKSTNGEVLGVVTMSDVLDALFEDFLLEDTPKSNPPPQGNRNA